MHTAFLDIVSMYIFHYTLESSSCGYDLNWKRQLTLLTSVSIFLHISAFYIVLLPSIYFQYLSLSQLQGEESINLTTITVKVYSIHEGKKEKSVYC